MKKVLSFLIALSLVFSLTTPYLGVYASENNPTIGESTSKSENVTNPDGGVEASLGSSFLPALAEYPDLLLGKLTDSDLPKSDGNLLRMWYKNPVKSWTNDALVQGNGSTGLMAFGAPEKERLHFNEKTLWAGGPAEGRAYIGGNKSTAVTKEELEIYRQKLDDKSEKVFPLGSGGEDQIRNLFGDGNGMGMYQDFGDIYLEFPDITSKVNNYVRDLNMRTGISAVNFEQAGVNYQREYFVSFPDDVSVVSLKASEASKISFTVSLASAGGLNSTTTVDEADKRMTLKSVVNDNQLEAEMQLRIDNFGGTVTVDEETITVTGADAVVLVYTTGTNYKKEYPDYRGEDPHDKITETIDAAIAKGYENLLADHLQDHEELFSRMEIDLGGRCPEIPTDELMRKYRGGDYAIAVEEMAFQFGRYLTIAGSREGDLLPTNLCGIWLIGSAGSFWGSDFHFNVNIQMNYWPTLPTNLAECQIPFNEFVQSLVIPGRLTAERSTTVATENFANAPIGEGNGFLINTQVNPFGHTAPIGSQEYGWNIGGSSWALQNIYEYYLFTGDKAYLADVIYPMLKEMGAYWNEALWYSPYQDRLTVAPSVSAEQGPTVVGTAYDQSLVWELYRMAIEASEILDVDEDLRAVWKENQADLDPIIIGEQGQVKEWFEETSLGKAKAGDLPEIGIPNFGAGGSANQGSIHRHTSQLVGLFPGTLISKEKPEWMDASIKSLEQRNLNGTGWSKAMKINMYARTGIAEDTYSMVRGMCAGNTNGLLDNLLDSHPPFQIDGNFGLTAGMAEMLVQSQLGYVQFLPALPTTWRTGSVEGLVARGNFVIDMTWEDGSGIEFAVTSRDGGKFTGEYLGISEAVVNTTNGESVTTESDNIDKISFETTAGETYIIELSEITASYRLQDLINQAEKLLPEMIDTKLDIPRAELGTEITAAKQAMAEGSDVNKAIVDIKDAIEKSQAAISLVKEIEEAKIAYDSFKLQAALDENLTVLSQRIGDALEAAEQALESGDADYKGLLETLNSEIGLIDLGLIFAKTIKSAEATFELITLGDEPWNTNQDDYEEAITTLRDSTDLIKSPISTLKELTTQQQKLDEIVSFINSHIEKNKVIIKVEGSTVKMESPYEELEIRYTIDSSDLTAYSNLYKVPIDTQGNSGLITAALFYKGVRVGHVSQIIINPKNLAPTAVDVVDSDRYDDNHQGRKAVDGSRGSRWATKDGVTAATLELTFAQPVTINSSLISIYASHRNFITSYNIEYWKDSSWEIAAAGEPITTGDDAILKFDSVISDKFRLNITDSLQPSIYEFELHGTMESLPEPNADKTLLKAELDIAEIAIQRGYMEGPETFRSADPAQEKFNLAYKYGMSIYESQSTDQITVDDATERLVTTLAELKLNISQDKETLKALHNKGQQIDLDKYDDLEKLNNFNTALAKAKELIDSGSALVCEVEEAVASLELAIKELIDSTERTFEELADLITKHESLVASDYTSSSWQSYLDVLNKAKAVTPDDPKTEITKIYNALEVAVKGLIEFVGKTFEELADLITKHESLVASDYTSSSWQSYLDALNKAKAIKADDPKTEITKIYNALEVAVKGLIEFAGKTFEELADLITKHESLVASDYTSSSWQSYLDALNKAKAIKPDDPKTEITKIYNALEVAVKGLIDSTGKTFEELADLITKHESLVASDYTSSSWQSYLDALNKAKAIKADDPKTEITKIYNALEVAVKGLIEFAGKTFEELADLITKHESLVASDYTSSSWQSYLDALNKAKAIKADDPKTEIAKIYNALEAAKEALVKWTKSSSGSFSSSGKETGRIQADKPRTMPPRNEVSEQNAIKQLENSIKEIKIAENLGIATIRVRDVSFISEKTLMAIAKVLQKNKTNGRLIADSMSGNSVEGRIIYPIDAYATYKNNVQLGVYTNPSQTDWSRRLFEKFFSNDMAFIKTDHRGPFDTTVEIAAKVNLDKIGTKNLYLYCYNKDTNTYIRLANPRYFVDKNGYFHFFTDRGGDIIISNKALESKLSND